MSSNLIVNLWKNSYWNLLGLVIPTLIVLPAMAVMSRFLGVERFGLFMLAFALLGYASIFDAGITRAIIRLVALNRGQYEKDRGLMGTALWAVLVLSVTGCAVTYFGAEKIIGWLNVTPAVNADALAAFELTAFAIPPTLLGMILFSYLEGAQQFARLSIYKTITGSLVAGVPAVVLFFDASLASAMVGLLIARLLTLVLAYFACAKDLGFRIFSFNKKILHELLTFGSWVTLSNIIGPVMTYLDRFILSNLIGANRVVFYTAPAEAIGRMSIIPGALSRTIFPLFSSNLSDSSSIASKAYNGLIIATIVIALPVLIAAGPILDLWLGAPYGNESGVMLQILVIGFVFNSLAQIPFARLQAHGKSRLTAYIHLAELLPYLIVLAVLVKEWGIHGAAIAWTLRITVDFLTLEYFSRQMEC